MNRLEWLRALRDEHDAEAAAHRRKAAEHGVEATRIAREIAELFCDAPRTRDELVIHLGWHHKRRPPLNATKRMLVAIHEKILAKESGA